jgi:hypothetical protein
MADFREKTKLDKDYDFYREIVDKIFLDTKADRDTMTKNYDHWGGDIWEDLVVRPQESKAIINYNFSTVANIAPTLTDNRPIITLAPKYEFLVPLAEAYNMALRYFWQVAEMDILTLKAWISALIMKIGLFKVYFDPALRDGDGDIVVDIEDPRNFFSAPGYTDPWKAPYMGVKCRRPISVVRQMFPKATWVEPEEHAEKESWDKHDIKYGSAESSELSSFNVTIYEIWEGPQQGNIIRESQGEKKIKDPYPYGKMIYLTKERTLGVKPLTATHGKPIWIPLYDYVDPFNSLGVSDVDLVRTLNQELNRQFQKLAGFINRYHDHNWWYDVNATGEDPEETKKILLEGGNFIPVDLTESRNGLAPFGPIAPPNMLPQVETIIGLIIKLMEEMTGVTEIAKGQAATKEQSASEASILAESSYNRTRQRVRNYEATMSRLTWVTVKLMQQYYYPERPYNYMDNNSELKYGRIGSSVNFANNLMEPPEDEGTRNLVLQSQQEENIRQMADKDENWKEYQEFIKAFGEKDTVYFDFDALVETNSSLPFDKQSLANLFLRLFERKGVDRRAILEQLKIPGGKKIADRMDAREQKLFEMKQRGAARAPGNGRGRPQPAMAGGTR